MPCPSSLQSHGSSLSQDWEGFLPVSTVNQSSQVLYELRYMQEAGSTTIESQILRATGMCQWMTLSQNSYVHIKKCENQIPKPNGYENF